MDHFDQKMELLAITKHPCQKEEINSITKTYDGNKADLLKDVLVPPTKEGITTPH